MKTSGDIVHGDESMIGVAAYKSADDVPAVRLSIVGGCDVDLTTEQAQLVALRLWKAGEAAAGGIEGHHVRWLVTPAIRGVVGLGEDFRRIGVESFKTADGQPCVELLIRDIASVRTQPQGAARVGARLLKAVLIAPLCDPLDAPILIEPMSDAALRGAAAIVAALDGLTVDDP